MDRGERNFLRKYHYMDPNFVVAGQDEQGDVTLVGTTNKIVKDIITGKKIRCAVGAFKPCKFTNEDQ